MLAAQQHSYLHTRVFPGSPKVPCMPKYCASRFTCIISVKTNFTDGSFARPKGKGKRSNAPPVYSQEASNTCAVAARVAPTAPGGVRQLGNSAELGEWRMIVGRLGRSSTGVVAINAVLLPNSNKACSCTAFTLWLPARLTAQGAVFISKFTLACRCYSGLGSTWMAALVMSLVSLPPTASLKCLLSLTLTQATMWSNG